MAMTLFVRATRLVIGTPKLLKFLDRRGLKTLETIDIKLDSENYVGDLTPHANCGISIVLRKAAYSMRVIVIIYRPISILTLRHCFFFTFLRTAPAQMAWFD